MKSTMIAKVEKRIMAVMLSLMMVVGVFAGMKLDVEAADPYEIKLQDIQGDSEWLQYSGITDEDEFLIYTTSDTTGGSVDAFRYDNEADITGSAEPKKYTRFRNSLSDNEGYKYGFINSILEKGVPYKLLIHIQKSVTSSGIGTTYDIRFYFVDNVQPKKAISNIEIGIPEPEFGQSLAGSCSVIADGLVNNSPAIVWTKDGSIVTGEAEANSVYTATISLKPDDTHRFYDSASIKMNGIEGKYSDINLADGILTLSYEFRTGDTKSRYQIIDGANSRYAKDSNGELTIKGNGDINKFLAVRVDNNVVDPSNYTATLGSTIITFKQDYLKTLSIGQHTFEIVWEDGTAKTYFSVVRTQEEVISEKKDSTDVSHICNFEWMITLDPTKDADGLEEYKCVECGAVQESHPIPASVAAVKDFYGNIKEASENGSITYDSGKLYTISDYLLKKMFERSDVTVTVNFEYQNAKYELTFPAGTDYTPVLTDEDTMYGYFGVAAKLGLTIDAK